MSDDEKIAKIRRENLQLIIYIIVALCICFSWLLGLMQASFLWIFLLMLSLFLLWKTKVFALTEEFIRFKELQLHRKKALRQTETSEWLNFLLHKWWIFSASGITSTLKRRVDPLLADIKPSFIDQIELLSFSLGDKTPFIKYVQIFDYVDGSTRRLSTWVQPIATADDFRRVHKYQIVIEADLGLQCDTFELIFRVRLGGRRVGTTMDVCVEKLNLSGKMQIVLNLDSSTAFPHVSSVSVTFLEKPEVWFSVKMLKAVQMMEIPLLKTWIHSFVMDGLTQAMVDPGRLEIPLDFAGPTDVPATDRYKQRALGVLMVTVQGEFGKTNGLVGEFCYCTLEMAEQKKNTQQYQLGTPFSETCSFLVYNVTTDKLAIRVKSKVLLSTSVVARYQVLLADFPLLTGNTLVTKVEDKGQELQLSLQFSPLPNVDSVLSGATTLSELTANGGVMYVCMHGASNLQGLDRNGLSDPYCVLYSNGKKIVTTHYVAHTKNPTWEVSSEFIVPKFNDTQLSFVLYDWDGRLMTEDDFLGAAFVQLSKEESVVIKKNLQLGFSLVRQGAGSVEPSNLGSVCVSLVFRPVPALSAAERDGIAGDESDSQQLADAKLNKRKVSRRKSKDSKMRESACKLLNKGVGLVDLNILQAKDLVAKDRNGFSDPYVEIVIRNEKKYATDIKKKTLDPKWVENVTLQLPAKDETLVVNVWDWDMLSKPDFLGKVTFTLDQLKKYAADSQQYHEEWFPLEGAEHGLIQLGFKVILATAISENDPTQQSYPLLGAAASAGLSRRNTVQDGVNADMVAPASELLVAAVSAAAHNGQARPKGHQLSSRRRGSAGGVMASVHETTAESIDPSLLTDNTGIESKQDTVTQSVPPTPNLNTAAVSSAMRRTASEAKIHPKSSDTTQNYSNTLPNPRLPGTSKASNLTGTQQSPGGTLKKAPSCFFGVKGELIAVRGLQNLHGQVYCKIRLDSRPEEKRRQKEGQGREIAKSKLMNPGENVTFGVLFEIDHGYGVERDALLILDIKTKPHKIHITTKAFTLQELLGNNDVVHNLFPLGGSIDAELRLTTSRSTQSVTLSRRRFLGHNFSFRKIKEKEHVHV